MHFFNRLFKLHISHIQGLNRIKKCNKHGNWKSVVGNWYNIRAFSSVERPMYKISVHRTLYKRFIKAEKIAILTEKFLWNSSPLPSTLMPSFHFCLKHEIDAVSSTGSLSTRTRTTLDENQSLQIQKVPKLLKRMTEETLKMLQSTKTFPKNSHQRTENIKMIKILLKILMTKFIMMVRGHP